MLKRTISFIVICLVLPIMVLYAATTGSIDMSMLELVGGLFGEPNDQIAVVKDLRFPRIVIALLAGATLSVSGVLLQSVMKNPLAEPGIIGVSAGAGFFTMVMLSLFPTLFFYAPLFAFIGGLIAFGLVYLFSWKSRLNPLHMILIGVAINALFTGLGQVLSSSSNALLSQMSISTSTLTMKTWGDVETLAIYGGIGLVFALVFFTYCNHLGMDDRTLRSLGFNVNRARLIVSLIAVLLASVTTAIAGMFTFVGLLIPHIGRALVGTDHKYLIPFSALLGAFLILLADTVGRTILAPIEIPASIVMVIIGGPFLIFVLRRSERIYGH